jgi:hypothetical protein
VSAASLATRFPPLDFDAYHQGDLPGRLADGRGRRAARDLGARPPLAFQVPDGRAYRYVPRGDALTVEHGTDGADVVVGLGADDFSALVHELHTPAGLFYGGRLTFLAGSFPALERWEPALRALWSGRPIFDRDALDLRGRDGAALDPARDFDLGASDDDLRHFLFETGYLVLRRVFAPDEVARLCAAADGLAAAARPGDRRSWWARTRGGDEVCCRVTYASLRDPTIAALSDDARLRRLGTLAGPALRPGPDRCDGHSLVIKHGGVSEGLADLPWHRDCGLGGHPVMCPNLQLGIQLDAATPETGRLHFLAGAWRASCHRREFERPDGLPIVAVDTEPGDVTVHFGDTLHAAPPPTAPGRGRRALYVSFFSPPTFELIPREHGYNDVFIGRPDGLVVAGS